MEHSPAAERLIAHVRDRYGVDAVAASPISQHVGDVRGPIASGTVGWQLPLGEDAPRLDEAGQAWPLRPVTLVHPGAEPVAVLLNVEPASERDEPLDARVVGRRRQEHAVHDEGDVGCVVGGADAWVLSDEPRSRRRGRDAGPDRSSIEDAVDRSDERRPIPSRNRQVHLEDARERVDELPGRRAVLLAKRRSKVLTAAAGALVEQPLQLDDVFLGLFHGRPPMSEDEGKSAVRHRRPNIPSARLLPVPGFRGGVRPADRRDGMTAPVSLAGLLDRAVRREAIGGGYSGASVERIHLDDGTTVVAKYLDPATDWQMRATGDDGREASLYLHGVLDRLGPSMGHAVLAAEHHGDGWVVIARDLAGELLHRPVDRPTWRSYLGALGTMHEAVGGAGPIAGLATITQRWGLWWPSTLAAVADLAAPQPTGIARGWDLLDDVAPPDVAEAVRAIVRNPQPLLDVLSSTGPPNTVLHGDAHAANLARRADDGTFLLLDWGLATAGPPAVEAAWLANFAHQFEFTIDELLDDIRELWAPRLDPHGRDLDAALAAQASSVIPALLPSAVDDRDPEHRQQTVAKLDWWIGTLRGTTERISPGSTLFPCDTGASPR